MPLVDVGAMNASLANDYGTTAGPQAAAYHDLELWYGDPRLDGSTELDLTIGGYARVRINPADWAVPDGGAITVQTTFADATDAWSAPATYWALRGSDGFLWDADAISDPIIVTGAGLVTPVNVVVYHSDLQAEDDD